jgi:hypothetical protein
MKKISYIIFFALCASACKKALDISPKDQISNDEYWHTPSDLNSYVLQFYSAFPNFFNIPGYIGTFGLDASNGSDLMIETTPVSSMNSATTATISGGQWDWSSIRAVNIFFENYKNVKASFGDIQQYVGEAYFFKAWFYFDKVRLFGDVPFYSHSILVSDSADLYAPRTKRTIVVDSILSELDSAISDLPYLKDVAEGNNRLTKEAALIFKSRVGLFEGSWEKYHAGTPFAVANADPNKYFQAAVNAATELMTPGKYNVGIYNTGNPGTDFNTLFSSTDLSSNKEVVLWSKYSAAAKFAHNFQEFVTSSTDAVSVTYNLIQNFLSKKGLPYNYDDTAQSYAGTAFLTKIADDCDPRLSQIIWIPGQTMWNNTAGTYNFVKPALDKTGTDINITGFQLSLGANPKDPTAGDALGFSTSCETGAVVFRYAEALLNYAEAQAELGKTVDYANSLDLLRARAGIPAFTVQSDPKRSEYADYGHSLTDELYEIRRERTIELACQGFRYDDWRRWASASLFANKRPLGFPYLASEYASGLKINVTNGFVTPFLKLLPTGYQFSDKDYLDNIPTNEITLNPNLKQNPGW